MSKKKNILSVFLLLFLIGIGIVVPYYLKQQKENRKSVEDITSDTEPPDTLKKKAALIFNAFEELDFFFSKGQIDRLKEEFPLYFEQSDLASIENITFLADKSSYPSEDITCLIFQLDNTATVPVYYSASKGAYFFGKEKLFIQADTKTYEQKTDDTLPSFSTNEIESMQEAGYDNTKKPTDKTEPLDAQTEHPSAGKEVSP